MGGARSLCTRVMYLTHIHLVVLVRFMVFHRGLFSLTSLRESENCHQLLVAVRFQEGGDYAQ